MLDRLNVPARQHNEALMITAIVGVSITKVAGVG